MTNQAESALATYSKSVPGGRDVSVVVADIDALRDKIFDGNKWTPADGEMMSQAIVKLASLNSFLGEHVATAEFDANALEAAYKFRREGIKLESMNARKTTATEADSVKIVETQPELEDYNRAVYVHKLLQNKRKDTSDFIDALRSRLSFMKIEMNESKNAK